MNLDFRKLSFDDQRKAVANLIKLEGQHPNYIAYLLSEQIYDLYSWYSLADTNEGWDYWNNLKNNYNEKV